MKSEPIKTYEPIGDGSLVQQYFSELGRSASEGWTRFWFSPADPLTACALRIATGLVAIYYHLSFAADLIRWFGPDGILPNALIRRLTGVNSETNGSTEWNAHPSIYSFSEDPTFLWVIYILGGVILLLFTVGFWTRLSNVLSLIVVLSLVHRAPMITGLLEPVLTMLLCYLCLTNCGTYLSLDRWITARREGQGSQSLAKENPPSNSGPSAMVTNVGIRLVQIHFVGFYLVLGLNKLGGEPWWNGDAMWWLIAHTESRLVDLTGLHAFPVIVAAWTHAVVLFELLFPILIWNRLLRPLLLVFSIVHWCLLAVVTGQVAFCMLMIFAGLAFIPSSSLRAIFQGTREPILAGD